MTRPQKKKKGEIKGDALAMLKYPDFLSHKTKRPRYTTEEMLSFVKAIERTRKAVNDFLPLDDDKDWVLEMLDELQKLITGMIDQRHRGPKENYNLNLWLYEVACDNRTASYQDIADIVPDEFELTGRDVERRVKRFATRHRLKLKFKA